MKEQLLIVGTMGEHGFNGGTLSKEGTVENAVCELVNGELVLTPYKGLGGYELPINR